MVNESRMGIYEYIENILTSITENVYLMEEPQELTEDDTTNGFIVVTVGDLLDASEFKYSAFGYARVYIRCYVPPISRGRLDVVKYKQFEDDINAAIDLATESDNNGTYWIDEDSIISSDGKDEGNADNSYYMFIKSFIVVVDAEQQNN
jgi:hypothetical protein